MPTKLTPDIVGEYEKFIFYGKPKTGKTFAAMTGPEPTYALLIGNQNELKSVYSNEFRAKYGTRDISFDVAKESTGPRGQFTDRPQGFDNVSDLLDAALNKDADPNDPFHFNTLVVDNATILTEFQMAKAMQFTYFEAKNKESTALKKGREQGIFIPFDNDYLAQRSLNQQFVSWLFELEKHVVLICHEYTRERMDRASKETTVVEALPLLTGKDRTQVPQLFDNVWHFRSSGQFFEALTEPDGVHIAGTRVGGVIPKIYRDVNLEDAIAKLQAAARAEPKLKRK